MDMGAHAPVNMKSKYQVFTPKDLVEDMLDLAGYRENLFGRKILENSCGNGRFLVSIASRYITDSLARGRSREEIREGLERDIVGYDIDPVLIKEARLSLDRVAEKHDIGKVEWDLRLLDFLLNPPVEHFSFVVGNPPYLEYKCLAPDYRKMIRGAYVTCSHGKFDYCYAFIEASLNRLNEAGVLVQLVPNSIFKNVFAADLRMRLTAGVSEVVDYAGIPVFDDALVSPCVFKYETGFSGGLLTYRRAKHKDIKMLERNSFDGRKWSFGSTKLPPTSCSNRNFGFRASAPVATLCNDAFFVGDGEVENEMTRRAVSPRLAKTGGRRTMIFPYHIEENGQLKRLSEEQLAEEYPKTFAVLSRSRKRLEARAADPSASWFEYGRSQGLASVGKRKLMLSTVVTEEVHVYELATGEVPYAGIVVTSDASDASLQDAKKLLESDCFLEYVFDIGTSVSGNSVRITCGDVNRFLSSIRPK